MSFQNDKQYCDIQKCQQYWLTFLYVTVLADIFVYHNTVCHFGMSHYRLTFLYVTILVDIFVCHNTVCHFGMSHYRLTFLYVTILVDIFVCHSTVCHFGMSLLVDVFCMSQYLLTFWHFAVLVNFSGSCSNFCWQRQINVCEKKYPPFHGPFLHVAARYSWRRKLWGTGCTETVCSSRGRSSCASPPVVDVIKLFYSVTDKVNKFPRQAFPASLIC
jgi:hypothetical protein